MEVMLMIGTIPVLQLRAGHALPQATLFEKILLQQVELLVHQIVGLVDQAEHFKAELIVMASHGRKGIKRLLLGSETLAVLTHVKIPVLVLR